MPPAIDDHVMRRDVLAGQIVFGIDHAGAGPSGAAASSVANSIADATEIDAAEKFGHRPIDLHTLIAALFHQSLGAPQLRVLRNALFT